MKAFSQTGRLTLGLSAALILTGVLPSTSKALSAVSPTADSVAPQPSNNASPNGTAPAENITYSQGITDVLKLWDAKVEPNIIKEYIKNSPTAYSPSAEEIIALRQRGVADDIVTTLLQRGAEVRAQQAKASQPSVSPTYSNRAAPSAPVYTDTTQTAYPNYNYTYVNYPYVYPNTYSYWGYNYGYPYYTPFYFSYYKYPRYYGHYGYWNRYGHHYGPWKYGRHYYRGYPYHGYRSYPYHGHRGYGYYGRGSFAYRNFPRHHHGGYYRQPFAGRGGAFHHGGGYVGRPGSFASGGARFGASPGFHGRGAWAGAGHAGGFGGRSMGRR